MFRALIRRITYFKNDSVIWPSTVWSTKYNCICILVLATPRITTWVAETYPWTLCNKTTFMHPSEFVGLLKNCYTFFLTFAVHMNTLCLIFVLFSEKKISNSEFGKIKFFLQNLISKGWRQCVWKVKWDWALVSIPGDRKCCKYKAILLQGPYVETVISLRARLIMFSIKIFNLTE
jgi:hypothetical protein